MTKKSDSVWFTTKGQVVIPMWLRKQFHIKEGTKAVVEVTSEGILLRPVTKHAINRLQGALRQPAGKRSLAQEWAEHKEAELALEEEKHGRNGS